MLLSDAVRRYLNGMLAADRSSHTVRGAKSALKELVAFLNTADVTNVEQINHDALLRYRETLSWRLTNKGTPLSARSQSELLGHLRAFCRWMVAQDWLVVDPSKRIPNPRKPQQLPKVILDETEVQRILAQPDLHTATGFRDRMILEVLYSSAIRRAEVAYVQLNDVDTEHGFLIVREGKNRKDRAVPIGAAVCALLETYIAECARTGPVPAGIDTCFSIASARAWDRWQCGRWFARTAAQRTSTGRFRHTRFATAAPRTCSARVRRSGIYRKCWGTLPSKRPRCTRGSPLLTLRPCTAVTIRASGTAIPSNA